MRGIIFLSRVGKNVDYMENLEISIQGLNHNSGWLDRVEISTQNTELTFLYTCNCTVILKRSLPLSRDKISIGSNELKFQPGLTISI